VKRNTSIRFGYNYRGGSRLGSVPVTNGVDFGVYHSRPLSPTRRASFGVTVGSSAINRARGLEAAETNRRLYRVHGDATAAYQFNARWQARASYRRELQYVPELVQSVFTNGIAFAIETLLTPRIDLTTAGGYSQGASPFSRDAIALNTYTANARLRFGLTRTLALYGEYLYYFYESQAGTPDSLTVPPDLERNGVRVGVTTWVPLLRR
jgi:hypothetical protein